MYLVDGVAATGPPVGTRAIACRIRCESYSNRFATSLSGVNLDNPATVRGRTGGTVDIRPGSFLQRSYEEQQKKPDDLEAQEGQRPIAVHALENLGHSDTGIVMLRRLLREQLQRVEQNLDPINTMRDPSANKRIPTGAWNAILAPAEAAALPYSEDL
jgi:hypothetical protein